MRYYVRRIFSWFLVLFFSFSAFAQENPLVGMWQMQNTDGTPGRFGKIFLPDGRLYGYSLEGNDSIMKTWIMGRYYATSPNTYSEDLEYHEDLLYMGHLDMTYSIEYEGRLLTTQYSMYGFDGKRIPPVVEKWSKQPLREDVSKNLTENWDKLLQEARINLKLVVPNDIDKNDLAEFIYNKVKESKERKLEDVYFLMLRAELDTTNQNWQSDVVRYMNHFNMAPSISEKYAKRAITLSEAKATTPTDTAIVAAYGLYGLMISHQEGRTAEAEKILRHAISLDEMSGRKDNLERGLLYMYLGVTNLIDGNVQMMYDNGCRATEIFEKSTDTPPHQKAEGHNMKALAKLMQKNYAECLQCLEKAIPLFEQGEPSPKLEETVFPMYFGCLGCLYKENPKAEGLRHRYNSFMKDKLVCAVPGDDKSYQQSDVSYIFEINNWDMDSTYAFDVFDEKIRIFLQCKGGEFSTIEIKEGESAGRELRLVVVDKAERSRLLKQWKKYRKKYPRKIE